MDFNFKKRDNEEYNRLINKGFSNLQMGAITDASNYFNKAKELINDPAEAHLGLSFISVLIKSGSSEEWLVSHDFTIEKQVIAYYGEERLYKDKDYILAKKLSLDNQEMQKIFSDIDKIVYESKLQHYTSLAYAELKNYYASPSHCKEIIDFLELVTDKSDENKDLIIKLKECFIKTVASHNEKHYIDTAYKYLKDIEKIGEYSKLQNMLDSQCEKNRIMDLYLKGVLTTYEKIDIDKYKKDALQFSLLVGRYVIAVKNSEKAKNIKDKHLKEIVLKKNEEAYKVIKEFLPTYISTHDVIDPFILENLEQLVNYGEIYKEEITPYLIQLSKKKNKIENKAKSLKDRIRSFFKLDN